jgi:hypothetical protein
MAAPQLSGFSEQGLVALARQGMLSYSAFLAEIQRRIALGESVHPYHALCVQSNNEEAQQ